MDDFAMSTPNCSEDSKILPTQKIKFMRFCSQMVDKQGQHFAHGVLTHAISLVGTPDLMAMSRERSEDTSSEAQNETPETAKLFPVPPDHPPPNWKPLVVNEAKVEQDKEPETCNAKVPPMKGTVQAMPPKEDKKWFDNKNLVTKAGVPAKSAPKVPAKADANPKVQAPIRFLTPTPKARPVKNNENLEPQEPRSKLFPWRPDPEWTTDDSLEATEAKPWESESDIEMEREPASTPRPAKKRRLAGFLDGDDDDKDGTWEFQNLSDRCSVYPSASNTTASSSSNSMGPLAELAQRVRNKAKEKGEVWGTDDMTDDPEIGG